MSKLILGVAVDNTVYHFDKIFEYLCSNEFEQCVQVGCRVLVPFGRGNKKRQAMVMYLKKSDESVEISKLKEIVTVLDSEPVLTVEMVEMVHFMKSHCFCTYYDAVRAMLPAGINYKITTEYSVKKPLTFDLYELSDERRRIVQFLLKKGTPVKKEVLLENFGYSDISVLDSMCDDSILDKNESTFRRTGDKSVKMVRIVEGTSTDSLKLTKKQNDVFELLSGVGQASVKEICYYTGVTSSVVDSLVNKGLAVYFDDEVFRIPKSNVSQKKDVKLTEEQTKAYDLLLDDYKSPKGEVSLLYGITGSGKTSVFMKLIEHVVSDNKGVIVMVPEIALTSQLISVFKSYFPDKVAVFHSGLSLGERLDEYKRVKRGMASIAIGTRSAVFAPFSDLGLIIMDEEQEHTYKSEGKPRFHARELAKFRTLYNNSLLVLASATPSVETYYNAKNGKYSLATLKNRYGKATLPDVLVADMNEEVQLGNTSQFSSMLLENIEYNLEHKKQTILLLNRRGHNTFVTCRNCRETVSCPNCSISMTYHSANDRMMCHYCGYSVKFDGICPTCNSNSLRFAGFGTQRAEAELANIFPDAKILRMDTDATMSKSSHEKKLSEFANGDYDILVGTQMVAKGLDFPNVTLVGVLSADQMLYSDDYRSFENAFSMITQVVGRSGRGNEKGRAVIQTFTPENPIISLGASQNYDAFYNDEIKIRKAMLYPPFAQMCLIGFVCIDSVKTNKAASAFMGLMTKKLNSDFSDIPIRVLGPSAASVPKVNNKYRYKIILKCRNDAKFRQMLSSVLIEFSKLKDYSDVTVYADMHPIEL
ncbi:MAG: primosomal protein N' [Ruminococcaceae bacterium]|nr:primosomal protein N' [Oscillospiraceae bacterium]